MAEVEWTNEAAIHLMKEYSQRPELWDTNHSLYRVQTAKYEAWSDLARVFECDIADLRKKLNSIFASHRREKGKIRCGGRSTWFLYPYMKFLPSHVENSPEFASLNSKEEYQSQTQNSDQTTSDEDQNDQETVLIKQEPVETRHKRKYLTSTHKARLTRPLKRRVVRDITPSSTTTSQLDSKLLEALKLLKRSELSRKKDECDTFGEYIATSLRKHDERTQSMIKQAINNILFEQEMKKYSGGQYTVVLTNMEENPLVLGDQDNDK